MTHTEKRDTWIKEGLIGFAAGITYGTTSVIIGHPLDTIKTKMQTQSGYEKDSMVGAFKRTIRSEGLRGLYRGFIPPLFGSGIYRSVQFAVFEACYTGLDHPALKRHLVGGLEHRVIAASMIASTVRAIIETPLELVKVRRQTGASWQVWELTRGFGITWGRTQVLLGTYFILIDGARRNGLYEAYPLVGPLLVSGSASSFGWFVSWPLELAKNIEQRSSLTRVSAWTHLRATIEREGVRGLYRGITPGLTRSFVANSISMSVMLHAQHLASVWGLRSG